MTDAERLRLILDRYLDGTLTPEEDAEFRRWVAADPSRQSLADRLEMARQRVAAGLPAVDVEHAIVVARQTRALRVAPAAGMSPVRVGAWVTLAAAAAVVMALVIRAPHRGHVGWREYATAAGERKTVTLLDGTQVTLAPASRVRVPRDYAAGDRGVALDGEALFAVVHDATHPFSVRAGGAIATDIGTQFDVRAYADDRDVRVAVAEGRVGIGVGIGRASSSLRPSAGRPYTDNDTIGAGDVARITDTGVAVTHGADIAALTAWVQGGLSFDNTPLRDAIRDVARTFGLTITIADSSLGAKPITSTFANEPVDEVLDAMVQAVGARYERVGRSIVIRRALTGASAKPGFHLPLSTARAPDPRP